MTDIEDSEDNGIGVGLSCSKIIANALKGDVVFVPNDLNKTRVSVTLMVKIYDRNRRNSNISQHSVSKISEFGSFKKQKIGQDLVTSKAMQAAKKRALEMRALENQHSHVESSVSNNRSSNNNDSSSNPPNGIESLVLLENNSA